MEIANMIYNYFGFASLTEAATLIDLLQLILKIGCGLWVTTFVIKCLFMATTIPNRGF